MSDDITERLRNFAFQLIGDYPDVQRLDRYDVVGVAESEGLIQKRIAHEPCGDGCSCVEVHSERSFSYGVSCFRLHPDLLPPPPEEQE